jgi:hypothetical protein
MEAAAIPRPKYEGLEGGAALGGLSTLGSPRACIEVNAGR